MWRMGPTGARSERDDDTVTVIIVDDQRPFRVVARRLVDRADGFEVVGESETGEDAVMQCASIRPSMVLMDVHLPGIDGVEATDRILTELPSTTVVLTSTYDSPSLHDDAAQCGAECYVRKEDLTPTVLREVWDRRQGRG